MQTPNTSFDSRNADPAKAPDYAFLIAGWPTVYTIGRSDYALAGDLAAFTSIRTWADFPSGSAGKVKGRPEEGKMTIGQMDIEVLDRVEDGVRTISSLLSRQAYLEGNAPGTKTFLTGAITAAQVDNIPVNSVSGLSNGQVVHISLEAIRIGTISGSNLMGCTRGYRLTSATPHASGVNVYHFLPNYYRRKAFIYKGYRQLPTDKWLRAYSGIITSAQKQGPKVSFSLMSTSWETYAEGDRQLFEIQEQPNSPPPEGWVNDDIQIGDFDILINTVSTANLASGHLMISIGTEFAAIRAVI